MYKVTRVGNEVKLMLIGESDAFLEPVETAEDSVLCMLFVVAADVFFNSPLDRSLSVFDLCQVETLSASVKIAERG